MNTKEKLNIDWNAPRFFNGDPMEYAKRDLENHRATIYHRLRSGRIETLFVKIIECKPDAIRCRWHDWSAGVTREHDLQGADITNWMIGAVTEAHA